MNEINLMMFLKLLKKKIIFIIFKNLKFWLNSSISKHKIVLLIKLNYYFLNILISNKLIIIKFTNIKIKNVELIAIQLIQPGTT